MIRTYGILFTTTRTFSAGNSSLSRTISATLSETIALEQWFSTNTLNPHAVFQVTRPWAPTQRANFLARVLLETGGNSSY